MKMNDITLTLKNFFNFKNTDIPLAGVTLLTGDVEMSDIALALELHSYDNPNDSWMTNHSFVGNSGDIVRVTLTDGETAHDVTITKKRNTKREWERITISKGFNPLFNSMCTTSSWINNNEEVNIQGHDKIVAKLVFCEQPEVAFKPGMIHRYVYPAKQLVLVDQIVGMYNRLKDKGTRVVVTSNSDYILMGLRIAIRKQQLTPEDVSIVYLYKDADKDTGISAMRINTFPNGELECWPEGFYDTYEKCLMELI